MSHRTSFWKTIVLTGGATLAAVYLLWLSLQRLPTPFAQIVAVTISLLAMTALGVTLGGLLALYRDSRQQAGKADIFYALTRPSRDRATTRRARALGRILLGPGLRPGDLVRVRSESEILRSLDRNGMLESLPFMPEMRRYCGQTLLVHRRVDKINDMITKTGLRRIDRTVTLRAVRCDGGSHDGCQAECQILWKEAWLQRVASSRAYVSERESAADAAELAALLQASSLQSSSSESAAESGRARYRCQITELLNASRPMKRQDLRQDLRALFWGNVGLPAFAVALLTRLFNWTQSLRGGVGYPWRPHGTSTDTPRADLGLQPGERVRVKDGSAIAGTLDSNSRNRGMWFDREMLRFCGQEFTVRQRVEKLIDERSGRMLRMKTPCIALEDVTATGEFLRFCPQNEYIFWREIWLEPISRNTTSR